MKLFLLTMLVTGSMVVAGWGFQSQTTLCKARVATADRKCTPGSIQSTNTKAICTPGWATEHRHVSYDEKLAIYAAYGIKHRTEYGNPGSYEIDHLVPLELGGSNEKSNLWPEPYPAYLAKDNVEDLYHAKVCNRGYSLAKAQRYFERRYTR